MALFPFTGDFQLLSNLTYRLTSRLHSVSLGCLGDVVLPQVHMIFFDFQKNMLRGRSTLPVCVNECPEKVWRPIQDVFLMHGALKTDLRPFATLPSIQLEVNTYISRLSEFDQRACLGFCFVFLLLFFFVYPSASKKTLLKTEKKDLLTF